MSSHVELREELKELKEKVKPFVSSDINVLLREIPMFMIIELNSNLARIKEIESEFKKADRLVSKWNYPYTNYLKALKNIRL